ncbi:MAG: hypothetical protein QG599_507 [Pseudomonadota bacterium]|nr:hypothetical protein [Pseudomonadota bacterium]
MMRKVKLFILATLLILPISAFAIGAIAVDDEEGQTEPGYGLVTGYDSKEAAKRAAIKLCSKAGNTGCEVVAWFETCGAYASSKKFYGAGWGKTLEAAEEMAVEKCGNDNCEVAVSECE